MRSVALSRLLRYYMNDQAPMNEPPKHYATAPRGSRGMHKFPLFFVPLPFAIAAAVFFVGLARPDEPAVEDTP
jgi:hypothetical protein